MLLPKLLQRPLLPRQPHLSQGGQGVAAEAQPAEGTVQEQPVALQDALRGPVGTGGPGQRLLLFKLGIPVPPLAGEDAEAAPSPADTGPWLPGSRTHCSVRPPSRPRTPRTVLSCSSRSWACSSADSAHSSSHTCAQTDRIARRQPAAAQPQASWLLMKSLSALVLLK